MTQETKTCRRCKKLRYLEDYSIVNKTTSHICNYCADKEEPSIRKKKGEKCFYVLYNQQSRKIYRPSGKLLFNGLAEAKKHIGSKFYKIKVIKIYLDLEEQIKQALKEAL